MEEETDLAQVAPVKKTRIPMVFLAFTSIILLVLVTSRDPSKDGPTLILLFLTALFFWLLSIFWLLFGLVRTYVLKKSFSSLRQLYTSVALASGCIFLVGLQTLGQLQLADIVLMICFELLLNFYLLRRF